MRSKNPQAEFVRALPLILDKSKICLLIIDMQPYQFRKITETDVTSIANPEGMISFFERTQNIVLPNTNKLINHFVEARLPIFASRFVYNNLDYSDLPLTLREIQKMSLELVGAPVVYHVDTPESQIDSEIVHQDKMHIFLKQGSSCFYATNLDAQLKGRAIDTLIIVGVYTNLCVMGTVRYAFDLGYRSIVISDATAGMSPSMHEDSLDIVDACLGRTCTTQTLIETISK